MDRAGQGPAAVVVERLLEAVNAHDLEAMVGCFADDYRNEETSGDVNAHTSRVVGTTAGAHTLAVDRPRQASAARRTASRGSRRLRTTRHARRAHPPAWPRRRRSEEHTSELQSRGHLVCRLLLEKKNKNHQHDIPKNKKKNKHKQ